MRYVVAVSGGVDSVVLLDMLTKLPAADLIVAHFDHGIRDDSASDARFVEGLASKYGVPFEHRREELGNKASEELARTRRYRFLRELAGKHNAKIVTAHHADDAAETVALNIVRGTGWRGVAAMDSDIVRPLITVNKQAILEYARQHNLEWHQDSTNASDTYLRNRIRKTLNKLPTTKRAQLLHLRKQQSATKRLIDDEVQRLIGSGPQYSRYFFTHVPKVVAMECLRSITQGQLTRPQLERALIAIKTARPGAKYQAGSGVTVRFSTRNFIL